MFGRWFADDEDDIIEYKRIVALLKKNLASNLDELETTKALLKKAMEGGLVDVARMPKQPRDKAITAIIGHINNAQMMKNVINPVELYGVIFTALQE